MTAEEACREIVASNAGEAYFKCLTIFPDPSEHPHWTGPFFTAILLVFVIVAVAATIAAIIN